MQKFTSLLVSTAFLLLQHAGRSQVWLGVYGMRTNSTNALVSPDLGGGFGMRFLSKGKSADELSDLKHRQVTVNDNPERVLERKKALQKPGTSLQIQFGGNFMYTGLGRKTFENVPLLAPQTGLAKVAISNAMLAMNVIGRFSLVNRSIFTPYADVFVGYRGMYSDLTVTPYVSNAGRQTQSTQSLGTVSGLNYGIGGGILADLTKNVQLDVGVDYAEALQAGRVADLNSAYADASGINLNLKDAPNGLMMIRVGLHFYLDTQSTTWEQGTGSSYGTTFYYPSNTNPGSWQVSTPTYNGGHHVGGSSPSSGGSNSRGGGSVHSSGGGWSGGSSSGGGAHVGVHVGGGGGGRAK